MRAPGAEAHLSQGAEANSLYTLGTAVRRRPWESC
ncbi:UNVERIFIED_ORG: hypothetical protein M2435_000027 [Rhizobium sophorae]|nr:hypothetical protein [Rhizobium leguminosarum]MDH6657132.1 hypothetical protein [Rhizobium sophorae]